MARTIDANTGLPYADLMAAIRRSWKATPAGPLQRREELRIVAVDAGQVVRGEEGELEALVEAQGFTAVATHGQVPWCRQVMWAVQMYRHVEATPTDRAFGLWNDHVLSHGLSLPPRLRLLRYHHAVVHARVSPISPPVTNGVPLRGVGASAHSGRR